MTEDFAIDLQASLRDACAGKPTQVAIIDAEREYLSRPAPNAIQWVVGREYCDSPSLYEYTRSYQVIRDLFQLRCPICNRGGAGDGEPGDCWGKTRMQLEDEVLLEWRAAHNDDVCPRCKMTRHEFLDDGLLKRYNQLHLCTGQRSGKSVLAGLLGTYVEHRLITLSLSTPGGLRAYFGLSLNDPFEMTFLASNEVQAKDTVWSKYRAFRRDSPWFQRYVPWVSAQCDQQVTPYGMEAWSYSESNAKIVNEHPDIFLICNSLNTNSAGLRGRSRVFGAIDEIAHMMDGDSRISADEVYRSIDNSLSSPVRSRAATKGRLQWLGLLISVSSPLAPYDKAMRLLRDAPRTPGMLAYHYPTWKFNPFEPRENFDAQFAKDPVGAQRDFGADPPTAASPLISDVARFRMNATAVKIQPTAALSYRQFNEGAQRYVGVQIDGIKLQQQPRYLAFDAGRNFDAFAGACAHAEYIMDPDTQTQRVVTVFDWVMRILPADGTEVYFEDVVTLTRKLASKMPIAGIELDQWNSVTVTQQLKKIGLVVTERSTTSDDYRKLRADVYNGLVRMLPPSPRDLPDIAGKWLTDPPFMAPESCALYELEALEEDPDTNKVTNPRKGERRGWNCARADTPVVLADGRQKLISNVVVGDRVIARDGTAQTVEAAWCEGTPDALIKLEVYGNRTFHFTAEHKWPVWAWPRTCQCGCGTPLSKKRGRLFVHGHNGGRGQGTAAVCFRASESGSKYGLRLPIGYEPQQRLCADDIRAGDFVLMPRKFDQVDTATTPGEARLLGYYTAEGWLPKTTTSVQFAFAAHERETWAADTARLLADQGVLTTVKHLPSKVPGKGHDANAGGLVLWTRNDHGRRDSASVRSWLQQHAGSGAATKVFSGEVMRWPLPLKWELVTGLFRGDGCQSWYRTRDGRYVFTVTLGVASEVLCNQVELLLAQLGVPTRRAFTARKTDKQHDVHYVKISAPWAYAFADRVWGTDSKSALHPHNAKMLRVSAPWVDDEFVYLPVKRTTVVDNGMPVFNLTVSGDHSYLVSNVATYNSNDVAQVCAHVHRMVQDAGMPRGANEHSKAAALSREQHDGAAWTAGRQGAIFNPSRVAAGGGRGRGW